MTLKDNNYYVDVSTPLEIYRIYSYKRPGGDAF